MPTPTEARRLERQEIKRRHRARAKRRPDLAAIRIGEINRVLTDNAVGELLPDTPQSRTWVRVAAHHLAAIPQDPRRSIPSWISLRAPWYTLGEVDALITEVLKKPRRWRAHTLGWLLKVTVEQRRRLRLTTIAAYDISPEDRDKLRKEAARARARDSRRKKGSTSRAQYLARVTAPKPWLAEGISRATWYRRHRPSET